MSNTYDFRVKQLGRFFDWRTLSRFGFYHYGVHRVLRVHKLCVFLWRLS